MGLSKQQQTDVLSCLGRLNKQAELPNIAAKLATVPTDSIPSIKPQDWRETLGPRRGRPVVWLAGVDLSHSIVSPCFSNQGKRTLNQ